MDDVRFAIGLTALVLLTIGVARYFRVGLGWAPLLAMVRATVQLGAVALLLRGVLSTTEAVLAFVALMLATASWTAGGRLSALPRGRRLAVTGVLTGTAAALAPVFLLGLSERDGRHVVAIAGIVIGGAMSAATLAGRRFVHSAALRRDEVEGWLALGATPSRAHDDIARQAVREALLPNLDQTRSTGLVTLPGAFVGALFGGAGPLEAARFQLVVLAAIALAMLVCALVVTLGAGRSRQVVVSEDMTGVTARRV